MHRILKAAHCIPRLYLQNNAESLTPETFHSFALFWGMEMEPNAPDIRDEHQELRGADDLKEIIESHLRAPASSATRPNVTAKLFRQIESANKELWVILSMFILAGLLNYAVASQRVLIGLYALPTIMSAYCYGRRHATLTAFASIIFVGLLAYYKPEMLSQQSSRPRGQQLV